jgi:hypothetical protein
MILHRALGISLLVFVATQMCCVVGAKILDLDLKTADPASMPSILWLIGNLSSVLFSLLGLFWYFKSPHLKPNYKQGFLFGLVAVLLGLILDGLALSLTPPGQLILHKYYTQPEYWTAFGLILTTCTYFGYRFNYSRKV